MTTGEIPLLTDFESVTSGFVVEKDGHKIPDMLADDMALILDTGSGACGYAGLQSPGRYQHIKAGQKNNG